MPFRSLAKLVKKKHAIKIPEVDNLNVAKVDKADVLFSVLKDRRSTRLYSNRDVSDKSILKIMEAARYAPSVGNYQPWEFIIVKEKDIRKQIVDGCYNQEWMLNAPVFIVACTNVKIATAVYGERGLRLYGIQSVAAAVENILLAAESMGLAACWVGAFSETIVSGILECPEYIRPCAVITLGYADFKPAEMQKQNIDEFVHSGKYGNTLQSIQVAKEKKPSYMKFH
jgi:nitroreductase